MYGQGFQQFGKSFDVPPTADLGGVMSLISIWLSFVFINLYLMRFLALLLVLH